MELAPNAFPSDVVERAKSILEDVKSVGAYTHSKGVLSIRKHVAEFLEGALLRHRSGLSIAENVSLQSAMDTPQIRKVFISLPARQVV